MVKPHENIGNPQQSTKIHGIHCHGGTEVMLGTNDAWHRNGEPKKVAEASPKHRSGRVRKGPEGSGRVWVKLICRSFSNHGHLSRFIMVFIEQKKSKPWCDTLW